MPTLTDLTALVEKLAAAIPNLNLDGDEQEEYSTMPGMTGLVEGSGLLDVKIPSLPQKFPYTSTAQERSFEWPLLPARFVT